jgi:hypothetical protein
MVIPLVTSETWQLEPCHHNLEWVELSALGIQNRAKSRELAGGWNVGRTSGLDSWSKRRAHGPVVKGDSSNMEDKLRVCVWIWQEMNSRQNSGAMEQAVWTRSREHQWSEELHPRAQPSSVLWHFASGTWQWPLSIASGRVSSVFKFVSLLLLIEVWWLHFLLKWRWAMDQWLMSIYDPCYSGGSD